MIQGIAPGPQVMTRNPDVFWGLIASMWVGNLFLVILNLPMIGVWVRLLQIPYRILFPAILVFCCIGVFSLNNNTFDVMLMVTFGAFGYGRSEEHTSELQSLMRISYAVFCLKKKKTEQQMRKESISEAI